MTLFRTFSNIFSYFIIKNFSNLCYKTYAKKIKIMTIDIMILQEFDCEIILIKEALIETLRKNL